jgi:hypothetical protein
MPGEGAIRASGEFRRLARRSPADLERLFAGGVAPSPSALVGSPYLGYNRPAWAEALRIRTFLKGFDPAGDSARGNAVLGHNSPVRQNGLDGDWAPLPTAEAPKRFGFFRVEPVHSGPVGARLPALLFDYDVPQNPRLSVARAIRDYVVALEPGSPDLLLGKAYLAIGPRRVPVSFFLLERHRSGSRPAEPLAS